MGVLGWWARELWDGEVGEWVGDALWSGFGW